MKVIMILMLAISIYNTTTAARDLCSGSGNNGDDDEDDGDSHMDCSADDDNIGHKEREDVENKVIDDKC